MPLPLLSCLAGSLHELNTCGLHCTAKGLVTLEQAEAVVVRGHTHTHIVSKVRLNADPLISLISHPLSSFSLLQLEANGQFSVIPRIYDEHLLNSEMEALTSASSSSLSLHLDDFTHTRTLSDVDSPKGVPGYSERCAEANRAKHHREPWLPTWTKLDQEKASQQQHQYDTPNGQWQQ